MPIQCQAAANRTAAASQLRGFLGTHGRRMPCLNVLVAMREVTLALVRALGCVSAAR